VLDESQLYRIDHYLGKEIVQNLLVIRFGNTVFSPLWNKQYIDNVMITFKEPFGIESRAGYFDGMGIVRDIMQNHLLQILSLVAMERPLSMNSESIRDEKVYILKHVAPLKLEDIVVGQYGRDADGVHKAYREEEDVKHDSITPTYACAVFHINNERWDGVPFIIKCGKGLNDRKSEVRIQFKPLSSDLFGMGGIRNELVCRVQPNEAIYTKIITKKPGLQQNGALISEMDLTYSERFSVPLPDAYETLIFDVLRGERGTFVRGDELDLAWQIFTPVLHELESKKKDPIIYEFGSRGPKEADDLVMKYGWQRQSGYKWGKGSYKDELAATYKEVADGDLCKDFDKLMSCDAVGSESK
jgi:glucose-6-phosphate 1-dehydrogenase